MSNKTKVRLHIMPRDRVHFSLVSKDGEVRVQIAGDHSFATFAEQKLSKRERIAWARFLLAGL